MQQIIEGGEIMSYIGTSIDESPVISGVAAAKIENGAFHAVVFDGNGKIAIATAGVNALGLLPAETPETIEAGEDVTVQIEDNGLWKVGTAAVAAGAELTSDATGCAITAATANYVTAIALQAGQPGDIIRAQIVKSGVNTITA
jgi:exosome complex RNA-binding protein Csl4